MTSRFHLAPILLVLCVACGDDDPDVDPTTSSGDVDSSTGLPPGSETAEPGTSSDSSTGDPTTGEPDTTTTGGMPMSCTDATTPKACAAASSEYVSCAWYDTTFVADPATCEAGRMGGVCLLSDQADGCTGAESSCPGRTSTVLARPAAGGGYEMVFNGPYCLDGIGDFELCDEAVLMDTGDLAEACTCACSLAP